MRNIKIYIFFLIVFFTFTSCGEGDKNTISADLYIKDHKFTPEVLELPAGKKIKIIVHNQDDTMEEFESFDLKREKIVHGNSQIRVILAPLKAGEYKFFGEFHPETAKGKLIIK